MGVVGHVTYSDCNSCGNWSHCVEEKKTVQSNESRDCTAGMNLKLSCIFVLNMFFQNCQGF